MNFNATVRRSGAKRSCSTIFSVELFTGCERWIIYAQFLSIHPSAPADDKRRAINASGIRVHRVIQSGFSTE